MKNYLPDLPSSQFDISRITDSIFVSSWPKARHTDIIESLGIGLILSMHWFRPSRMLDNSRVELLWLPTFDSPLFPMPMNTLIRGVQRALGVLQDGKNVLCHCRAGRHRGAAMACCVLIATGFTAQQAVDLVKLHRPVSDPDAWYIRSRIDRFEHYWKHL